MPKENYLLQNNIMLFFSFCLVPIVFAGAVQWYVENQSTGNFDPLHSAVASSLFVTSTGNYKVEVTDTTGVDPPKKDIVLCSILRA